MADFGIGGDPLKELRESPSRNVTTLSSAAKRLQNTIQKE
jgi:hypothetical protein